MCPAGLTNPSFGLQQCKESNTPLDKLKLKSVKQPPCKDCRSVIKWMNEAEQPSERGPDNEVVPDVDPVTERILDMLKE